MKNLKIIARLFGALAILVPVSSCSKDDSKDCCSYSYTEDGNTYSYEICSDGSYTYIYNGESYTDDIDFEDYGFDGWDEIKGYLDDAGWDC